MENVPDVLKQALDERNRTRDAVKKTKAEIEEAKLQLDEVRSELSSSEAMALDGDEKSSKKRTEVRTRFTEARDKLEFLEARLIGLEKNSMTADAEICGTFPTYSSTYNSYVEAQIQEYRDRAIAIYEQHVRPLLAEGYGLADVLGHQANPLYQAIAATQVFDPASPSTQIVKFDTMVWDPKHKMRVDAPAWKGNPAGEAAYEKHKETAEAFRAIERIYQRIDKDRREAEVQRKYHELAGKAPAA